MDTRLSIPAPGVTLRWSGALVAISAYFAWLLVWYWPTVVSMVWFWYRYETYAHGFVVFPISLWLAWRDRRQLASLPVSLGTSRLAIVALLGAAMLWLLGDLTGVLPARQYALIGLFVAGIWVILGDAIFRRLAFPLGFLLFAVPIGEALTPTMIEWTANFTVASLRLSGVPVLREGMTFRIPTGAWSVVDACSGIRYLIASVMVGVLYAYLSYRSLGRRLAFVVASILVPIVANWLRAYMIVMIGHLSNNRLAVGVDHILYGWIFFGIVMLLMYWIGSFWREDLTAVATVKKVTTPLATSDGQLVNAGMMAALLAAFAIAAAPPSIVTWTHWRDQLDVHGPLVAPILDGWSRDPQPLISWRPRFSTPREVLSTSYVRGDQRAGLYVAIYYAENSDSKLVSSVNRLVRPYDPAEHAIAHATRTIATPRGAFDIDQTLLRVRDGLVLVHRWYWIDGVATTNSIRAKLLQARARLSGRGDAGAIVVTYVRVPEDSKVDTRVLDDLTRETAARLPASLVRWLRPGGVE